MTADSSRPAVSVVIATYNMARYLGEAIASVLGQTMDDLDVHVVDDGSTDNTRELVARFAGDPRVHYYWQSNAGQTRAKNCGIRNSRGALLAFCDADDMWRTDKLERQCALFDDAPEVGVVYSRCVKLLETGAQIEAAEPLYFPSGRVTAELFKYNFVPFGTAVVKRTCFDRLGDFDERYRMGIDWELWLRLSTQYEFRFLDAITYVYRVWPGQMSSNWRGRYEHCFRIMDDFLSRHPRAVPKHVVREAWAHSYVERARVRCLQAGEHGRAVLDVMRALQYKPGYLRAWKSLGRIGLTVAGLPWHEAASQSLPVALSGDADASRARGTSIR
jgi:glycosyltransferase involved in cell wall biosynthesis